MSDFKINFEWEAAQTANGAELRATWARLELSANGVTITQVLDYSSNSVRNGIYLPLYPLAEWIATHWWTLFHEFQSPTRLNGNAYARRHNLRHAREGFALPNLTFSPEGDRVRIEWQPEDLPECRVRFLTGGTALVEARVLEDQLRRFLDATLIRLQHQGVHSTILDDEWNAIQSADSAESAFCRVAAQLGLDPFDLDPGDQQAIIDAHELLPETLTDDFFAVAELASLPAQAAAVQQALVEIAELDVQLPTFVTLRAKMPKVNRHSAPWKKGYEIARHLRDQLNLNGHIICSLDDFPDVFKIDEQAWAASQLKFQEPCRFVTALVGINRCQSPGFLIEKQRDDSRKFAFCRALFEFLTAESEVPALVSETRSERQKRNRAFAAEFLAPASMLQARLHGDTVSDELVDEIACDFCVSPYVIRHQIENHELAQIVVES